MFYNDWAFTRALVDLDRTAVCVCVCVFGDRFRARVRCSNRVRRIETDCFFFFFDVKIINSPFFHAYVYMKIYLS